MQSLDERMIEAGMIPVSEILKGRPIDKFMHHTGVVDIDTFGQWLEMRYSEMLRMQARMKLEGREEDELYEWVMSHCASLGEVRVNFREATKQKP